MFEFFFFLILGLVLGRLSSVLADYLSEYEVSGKKQNFFLFFSDCQKEWGFYPLSCLVKKLKKIQAPIQPCIIEILMPALFVLLFGFVGWKYSLIEYIILVFALVTASAVDIKHFILPDSLTLSGIVIGLLGALLNPEPGREFLASFSGVLLGGGFLWLSAILYYALRKEEGLGGGDIKLTAWLGAVLTWKALPFVILTACFSALLFALVQALFKKNLFFLKQNIPFGPYLGLAGFLYILYGEPVSEMYLSLFLPIGLF